MPFLVKIYQHIPEEEIPLLDNTPKGGALFSGAI